jgi:hypothetical protein
MGCTDQKVRERRDGTGERDLRPKEIGIQVEISAVRRPIVTAEIRDHAKDPRWLEGCGGFPAVRVYVSGGEKPANPRRADRNGASARRSDDYRAADGGGVENLHGNSDVGKTSKELNFVLRFERRGKRKRRDKEREYESDFAHEIALQVGLGIRMNSWMRGTASALLGFFVSRFLSNNRATTFPSRSTLFFLGHA